MKKGFSLEVAFATIGGCSSPFKEYCKIWSSSIKKTWIVDLGILKKYFSGEEVDEKLNLVNIVEFAYLSCIYICLYSVAAPGNFSRVFITKLEYNIIKKKKKNSSFVQFLLTRWDVDMCTKTVQNWTCDNISTGPVLLCTGPKLFP